MLNEDTIEQMLISVLQKNGWTYISADDMLECVSNDKNFNYKDYLKDEFDE